MSNSLWYDGVTKVESRSLIDQACGDPGNQVFHRAADRK
jgi:hypothetical protein